MTVILFLILLALSTTALGLIVDQDNRAAFIVTFGFGLLAFACWALAMWIVG